jgi:hypothetical protein
MSWNYATSLQRKKKKYGNITSNSDGRSFASKLEMSVYSILKLREKAGEIEIVQCQDHIYLTKARIGYIADFKCKFVETGDIFHVEAKGYAGERWQIIKRLWLYYGPNKLEIWTGSYLKPQLTEEINPKDD